MTQAIHERVRDIQRLWAAVLLPLGAWALQMSARYAIQPWLCKHSGHAASDAIALVALVLALAGGALGWHALATRRTQPADAGLAQLHQRERFMAALALGLCAMFVLVIIAQWLPERILSPCPM
jgi:hypothetical protein